jgi:hypothetical protein
MTADEQMTAHLLQQQKTYGLKSIPEVHDRAMRILLEASSTVVDGVRFVRKAPDGTVAPLMSPSEPNRARLLSQAGRPDKPVL